MPLVIEYEATCKRFSRQIGLTYQDIDDVIDYLCEVGNHHQIHFLWRPFLKDPGDDLVLEVAVGASSEFIVTHNVEDFQGSERFGIQVITPQQFLKQIEN